METMKLRVLAIKDKQDRIKENKYFKNLIFCMTDVCSVLKSMNSFNTSSSGDLRLFFVL